MYTFAPAHSPTLSYLKRPPHIAFALAINVGVSMCRGITHIRTRGFITSKRMLVACVRPPLKVQPKENRRVQKLKKIWKIQKQMKKEEKDLFRELWEERLRPVEYDLDFDDLFDSF